MDYFVNLCRICMCRNGKLHDIYQPDTDTIKYIDKLWICFPELFSAENFVSLSHQICEKCCNNLKTVFKFRNQCMDTNSILKEIERKYEAETKNCAEYGSDNDNGVGNVEVEINEITGDDDSEVYLAVTDSTVKIASRKISLPKADDIPMEEGSQDESDEAPAPNNSEIINDEHSQNKKWKNSYYKRVSSERYPCTKCDKAFRFQHEIQSHLKEHSNRGKLRKPRTCLICSKTFSKHYSLKTHMLKKHVGINLGPQITLTQVEEINKPEEHIKQEPEVYPPEEIFLTEAETYNIHDSHHMLEDDIHTLEGNVLMNQEDNLPKEKTRFPCHLCHKTFSDRKYFRKHLLYHENDQRFVCELCHQNFTTKSHMTRHIKAQKCVRHAEVEKVPIVPVPQEKKVLKKRLKKERVTGWKVDVVHTDPVRKQDSLLCTICSIEFSTKYFLAKHMLIHEKDESLICTVCSEECTTKYFLKKHMILHEKSKLFCSKCSLQCKSKSELDKHNKCNHLEEEVPKVKEI